MTDAERYRVATRDAPGLSEAFYFIAAENRGLPFDEGARWVRRKVLISDLVTCAVLSVLWAPLIWLTILACGTASPVPPPPIRVEVERPR